MYELFSKLKTKREKAGQPKIYQYNSIPKKFRNQVVHIWRDAIGVAGPYSNADEIWYKVHNIVSRELGLLALGNTRNPSENCVQFLFNENTDQVLDIIQVSFSVIEQCFSIYNGNPEWMRRNVGLSYPPTLAIEELNLRFLENDLGYQYQNGQIIQIDSQFAHSEIILPALQLLNDKEFKPAMDEFLKAHEHYRKGRFEEAINDALKAFESTLKIIIVGKGWPVSPTATASKLIQTCFDNQLLPLSLSNHLSSVRTTLEAGLPTIRNKFSGHGDGISKVEVPSYLVQYALNLAATNILFLISAYKS